MDADQIIPAGGRTLVRDGLYDLACTDLKVEGTLDTGTGVYVNVRNLTIGASGAVVGSGTINYSGSLSNAGSVGPNVSLAVNPPWNAACPGPVVTREIPALGNSMLAALAGLLLALAGLAMPKRSALRRQGESKGARK